MSNRNHDFRTREFTDTSAETDGLVSISPLWLEERNSNITEELSRIADLFSDFKFVNEIREEMNKVNECMVLEKVCVNSSLKRE